VTRTDPTRSRKSEDAAASHRIADYVPLYYRVYTLLLQHIRDHGYDEHTPLPTEAEFAERFQVSRVTLRKAMNILEADGLITRQRGRGTFARKPVRPPGKTGFSGLIENIVHFQETTKVKLLAFERVGLPTNIAPLLDRQQGEPGLRIVRVRSDATSPFSHITCYLPEPEASLLKRNELRNTPVSILLERQGVKATQAEQWISATLADKDTAQALQVEMGSALISLTRIYRDTAGRPIEILHELYRPDRYEYRVNLSRVEQGDAPRWSEVPD